MIWFYKIKITNNKLTLKEIMDFIYISQRKIMNLDFIQLKGHQIEKLNNVSILVEVDLLVG